MTNSATIKVVMAGFLSSGLKFEQPANGKPDTVYCSVPARFRINEKDDFKDGSLLGDKLKEAMRESGVLKKLAVRVRDDIVDIDGKEFHRRFIKFRLEETSLADAIARAFL